MTHKSNNPNAPTQPYCPHCGLQKSLRSCKHKTALYWASLWHPVIMALAFIALLLGTAVDGFGQTASGITINDPYGYTHKSERWIAKRERKKRRNLGDVVANAFRQDMTELAMFPAVVDADAQDVMAEFAACHNMSSINLSQVSVTIEAEPFQVEGYPQGTLASGVAYLDGRIKVVFWNIRDDIGPQLARALSKGELRNYLWWKLHGSPKEMWGVPACP